MEKKMKILLCILAVAVVICLLPLPSVHRSTLNAVKLDDDGNELGTVEIPLEYVMQGPLFRKVPKRVTVAAFDGNEAIDNRVVTKKEYNDYFSSTFVVAGVDWDGGLEDPDFDTLESYSYRCIIKVSEDADRWLIRISPKENIEYFYVGSLSGESTTAELMEFFQ